MKIDKNKVQPNHHYCRPGKLKPPYHCWERVRFVTLLRRGPKLEDIEYTAYFEGMRQYFGLL